jgi:hypothetical protein
MKALLILSLAGILSAPALAAGLDTAKIEALTGLKGQLNEKEGVFKVSYPRSDIESTARGVRLTPPMGLTAWVAFQKTGDRVMAMGDLVLLEDQVNPVMSAALDNGLEVTALHNHFFGDTPKVMFMHVGGMGEQDKLAAAVGAVFAKLKETSGGKGETLSADIDPAKSTLTAAPLEAALGAKAASAGGALKFTFDRSAKMSGHEIGGAMGVNTWAAFAGADEKAVVDGDFAMKENEVQSVLKALRKAGIDVVAIHNHMIGETPRIVFLHYWGVGPAVELAKGVRAALDTQGK